MCGILAIFSDDAASIPAARAQILLDRMAHRGPDARGVHAGDFSRPGNKGPAFWLGHRRLAIVDPEGSPQPFTKERVAWVANAEIYNHVQLRADIQGEHPRGDCAVLGPLWKLWGEDLPDRLLGPFALVLVDEVSGEWMAARDAMGICPLYRGRCADGSIWFASEMKALIDDCEEIESVAPGTLVSGRGIRAESKVWYAPRWEQAAASELDQPADEAKLRQLMIDAVVDRLMSDVPSGVLLSGGLDSSLVAAIAARHAERFPGHPKGSQMIATFSIGMKGSPDLAAARKVARFIGSDHHEFEFTSEEALAVVPKVVYHLESFEQIRTAVPTLLLAQKVKALGIKMVLSGEGADEIFGGYLYFHRAPDAQAFHEETVRKLRRLHQFDVMRANKAPMAFGLELRFPFLDRRLVDWVMELDPRLKMVGAASRGPVIEKHLLRSAFDEITSPWLPQSTLWRQKEQFSDGVGYDWVDSLKAHAETRLGGQDFEESVARFGDDAPASPEMLWMRELFEERFVRGRAAGASALATVPRGKSLACSTPEALAWHREWSEGPVDMSGRAATDIHSGAKET
ncbi:MAG: asparagine synthase B [Planctomycetota bacterium]